MPGVYISFPFCAQKCTYCNFASGAFPRELEREYLGTLIAEIRSHQWQWMPETVYIGGGTPSRLDPPQLASILHEIPASPWKEATLEAAPGDITADRASGWCEAGINRVSLGVQSFIPRELAQTGRKHTAETVEREVALLRAAGIGRINLDLIAGLPFQTLESFNESLDWVLRLNSPHVSVYMLEVDDDSRLGREMISGGQRYGAASTPDEALVVEMYELARRRLADAGIERYEISNFARRGAESLHNLKYWRLEPYAGFGADAHSFSGRLRSQNVEAAAEYVARSSRGEPVRIGQAEANQDEERFFVGLRLEEGISLTAADWTRFRGPIERYVSEGLMESHSGRLRLTDRGVLYSNEVLGEFITL